MTNSFFEAGGLVFGLSAAALLLSLSLLSLSLSLSLSLGFARGLAPRSPRFRAAFKLPANQSGFSLLGTLAGASVIGLVVIMGTTQSFIQQKISLLALEKRIKQIEITRRGDPLGAGGGQQKLMGKAWSCLNTLKGHSLSGADSPWKKKL